MKVLTNSRRRHKNGAPMRFDLLIYIYMHACITKILSRGNDGICCQFPKSSPPPLHTKDLEYVIPVTCTPNNLQQVPESDTCKNHFIFICTLLPETLGSRATRSTFFGIFPSADDSRETNLYTWKWHVQVASRLTPKSRTCNSWAYTCQVFITRETNMCRVEWRRQWLFWKVFWNQIRLTYFSYAHTYAHSSPVERRVCQLSENEQPHDWKLVSKNTCRC